nr:NAD(P)H-binding protein [Angustibacter aerolatus]
MRVAVAGGHGQVARRLTRLLHARGDEVLAIVRDPDHVADVEADGATAVLLDLERAAVDELAAAVRGCDAVVFSAGAGPGSGDERKGTVDHGAAVLLADAAEAAGVPRYQPGVVDRGRVGARRRRARGPRRRLPRLPAGQGWPPRTTCGHGRRSTGWCCDRAGSPTSPAPAWCTWPRTCGAATSRATTWRPCRPSLLHRPGADRSVLEPGRRRGAGGAGRGGRRRRPGPPLTTC